MYGSWVVPRTVDHPGVVNTQGKGLREGEKGKEGDLDLGRVGSPTDLGLESHSLGRARPLYLMWSTL